MSVTTPPPLTMEEWNCLRAAADACLPQPLPTATLARLEEWGLLMRGWGLSFVLTEAGQLALAQRPAGDVALQR